MGWCGGHIPALGPRVFFLALTRWMVGCKVVGGGKYPDGPARQGKAIFLVWLWARTFDSGVRLTVMLHHY